MKKFISFKCKCGKKLWIRKPGWLKNWQGGKSHANCPLCYEEWHLTFDGRLYSHPGKLPENFSRPLEKLVPQPGQPAPQCSTE